MEYFPKNPRSKWDDCVEGAKSDAITRCCKDLGIYPELWDWRFQQAWKKKYAIMVDVLRWKGNQQVPDRWWRHVDKDPYKEELLARRGHGSEYARATTIDQENQAHMDAMREGS